MKNKLAGIGLLLGFGLCGCGDLSLDFFPSPESVLEGRWQFTFDEPPVGQTTVTALFNQRGRVIELTFDPENGPAVDLAVSGSETSVIGDAVTISIPTFAGDLLFEGTLNDDADVLTGTLEGDVELLGTQINFPAGEIAITRIEN